MTKIWHNISLAIAVTAASLILYASAADAKPLTHWTITSLADGVQHKACVAARSISPAVSVTVQMDAYQPTMKITLQGVNFGHGDDYGLWAIDNGDPLDVYISRENPWRYSFMIDVRAQTRSLKEFRDGRKLSVLLGEKKFVVDLTETTEMVRRLQKCNADGQKAINRKRMADAALVATRT